MVMTNLQLYLTIGLPVFAVMMGILAGMYQTAMLNARMTSLETAMNARFSSMEARFANLEARFDTLIGKVVEIDNRLTRVETLLERH